MDRINDTKGKYRLRFVFVMGIALILVIAITIVIVMEYCLVQTKLVAREDIQGNSLFLLIMFGVCSIIIGLSLVTILEKFILKPINRLLDGMEKLGKGKYTTRIDMGMIKEMKQMSDCFNKLAMELQNTELLRSDFVNNFSHELKTPLVSVSGLISLMKNEDLPADKRKKYLEIIEEETNRLAEITTNLLNLSRVEKQTILTDVTKYNLSEQIRTCVLLLERKWQKKEIEFSLNFDEIYINANEDMLKQVWINLLDNAIKFSSANATIVVNVVETENDISVSVINSGSYIAEMDREKIFTKFYRGENSKSGEGNGIGLSIVKNIVEKHNGDIICNSENATTEFKVTLPKA